MQGTSSFRLLVMLLTAALLGSTTVLAASTTAGAQASTLGAELTTTTTCLAGNGRVDTSIVNTTDAPATYRLNFQGLSARQIVVEPGDWGRIPITGRPDGDYSYQVLRDNVTIRSTIVSVGCDGPVKEISTPEATVINSCRDGNGYILAQMANPTPLSRPYVIKFTGVKNRSQTAAPYGAAVRAVTGRPDGTYNLTVQSGATIVLQQAVTVDCDAGPNPTPTPTPGPTATPTPTPVPVDGDDISVSVNVECPAIGTARIVALVSNSGATDQPASLVVFDTATEAGEVTTATARAGQTTILSQSDLSPSGYRITVSVGAATLYDQTQNIFCAPTPTPAPPTPTPTPSPTPVENRDPNAATDTIEVQEDDGAINVTAGLLSNDEDADGNPLTIVSIDDSDTVGEVLLVDGVVTYSPNGQFEDLPEYDPVNLPNSEVPDFFTYTISDGNGGTDTATATMVILGNNDAPTAGDDVLLATLGVEKLYTDWYLNDDDIDQAGADLLFIAGPETPRPTANGGTVVSDGFTLAYTSEPNTGGWDTFTYQVEDGIGGTSEDVNLFVLVGFDSDPVELEAGDTASGTLLGDGIGDTYFIDIAEGAALTLDIADCNGQGVTILFVPPTGDTALTNNCTDTSLESLAPGPYAIFVFEDLFDEPTYEFTITDAAATNETPVAVNDEITVGEDDGPVDLTALILNNDTDGDGPALTISAITAVGIDADVQLVEGIVTFNPNGQYEYLAADEEEPETFTYTVTDGTSTTIASVTVRILGANDAPIPEDDFAVGVTGANEIAIDVLLNDTDPDLFDLVFVENVQSPTAGDGTAAAPNDTVVRYTPADGFTGWDTINFDATDGLLSVPSKALVLVGAGPEEPEPYSIGSDAQATILLSQDDDVESKEGWFYFELSTQTTLQLESNCGFAQQGGVEFQILDTSNNSAANLSCGLDTDPRVYPAGMYAIRVFSANANLFEVTPTFSFTEAPG